MQAGRIADGVAAEQAAELAAQDLRGQVAAAAAGQAEAEGLAKDKAAECAGQAEQLAESAGRHGALAAEVEQLRAQMAATAEAEGEALLAARERVNGLNREVAVMQVCLLPPCLHSYRVLVSREGRSNLT
eukprot:SAG22_NODE_155_length_17123_cov_37.528489_3_plen_130_part_00